MPVTKRLKFLVKLWKVPRTEFWPRKCPCSGESAREENTKKNAREHEKCTWRFRKKKVSWGKKVSWVIKEKLVNLSALTSMMKKTRGTGKARSWFYRATTWTKRRQYDISCPILTLPIDLGGLYHHFDLKIGLKIDLLRPKKIPKQPRENSLLSERPKMTCLCSKKVKHGYQFCKTSRFLVVFWI